MGKNILFEKKEGIGLIKFNRPDKLNALNYETLDELETLLKEIKEDKEIKVVIFTGAGEKAFVAGADINELSKLDPLKAKRLSLRGQRIFSEIENLEKPTIAAINGFALGGGCELALSCSIRIASTNAKIGQPEVKLGLIPGYGGTQRLARLIAKGHAMELILTGEMVSSEEALRIGIVNKVVPLEELMLVVESIAKKIIANGPLAVRLASEAINRGLNLSLEDGLILEANLFGLCFSSEDAKEGTSAFLEKRIPVFKGE
ncbi:MAG: enoyl-CoA hydratase-related protein [Acidobacteriota bacterium]